MHNAYVPAARNYCPHCRNLNPIWYCQACLSVRVHLCPVTPFQAQSWDNAPTADPLVPHLTHNDAAPLANILAGLPDISHDIPTRAMPFINLMRAMGAGHR